MRVLLLFLLILASQAPALGRQLSADQILRLPSPLSKTDKSLIDFDEESAMTFGRGYDSLTDTVMGDCVERGNPESPNGSEAKRVTFSLDHITSTRSLVEKFNLSASASLKKGFGKASAKAQFLSENNLSEYSVYVLAKVQVKNILRTLRDVKLKPEAVNLQLKNPEVFRRTCGNEYVAAMTTGGEFYAILEIETSTVSEKQEIMTRLKGSVGTFRGAGEFSKVLSEITSRNRTRILVYQVGGRFSDEDGVPTTPEQIIAHAKVFDKTVQGQDAMPITVSTFPYRTLINFPTESTEFDASFQEKVISKMVEYQNQYLQYVANIDYILNHQDQFINPDVELLNQARREILGQINLVTLAAKNCFSDFNKCQFPEDLGLPKMMLPQRVAGVFWRDLCEFKKDPVCGVLHYRLSTSQHCGVKEYQLGRGPSCGVELYKLGRSQACGVVHYQEKQDPLCGTRRDFLSQEYDPGYRNCWVGRENVSEATSTDLGLWDRFFPQAEWLCPRKSRRGRQSICQNRLSGHWHIICTGEVAQTCRRPEFGVEEYAQCRAPAHGAETYLPCRDSAFGIESYHSCRHPVHGAEEYKSCYAPKAGQAADLSCSQNPEDYD